MSLPKIPPFYSMKWSNPDGRISSEASLYNDELSQTLISAIELLNSLAETTVGNGTVTVNGIVPPSKTTAEITALEPNSAIGTLWFDTNIAKLKVKTAPGVVETITST